MPRNLSSRLITATIVLSALSLNWQSSVSADDSIAIGSQRELFTDTFLIDRFEGGASLQLHRPVPKEVVFTTDKPWEGNTSAYFTIFQDGDLYRMYYRGSHWDVATKKATHREVTCYAESQDGIHWTKPDLGLFEFEGSKQNNIVWDGVGTHCFAVFKDGNPECAAEARYKAISRGAPTHAKGLYVFQSADAIHWKLISEKPVITEGYFDSQNLAFWDSHEGEYREYHRTFEKGVRHIMTGTSHDFVHWTKPKLLSFPGAPIEHLYTNAVRPYPRAPQLLIAFPTRYLPKQNDRVEPIFMSSRDRQIFHRWTEAVIPESAPKDRAGNRSNYMTWGLLQLPGNDREYSVYATEAYYTGPDSRVRRFTYRVDGFVSVHAESKPGAVITKPIQFTGDHLIVNSATSSKGGSIKVELQNSAGESISGFTATDCDPITADQIDQTVTWNGKADLSEIEGQTVRIRFEVTAADLYSYKFSLQ